MTINVIHGDLLIVDDNPNNLRLLAAMLSDKGYKVRSVINGQMALTAVKTSPPDLILLDINMPDMNGYQVCEKLKADEISREIPVIFISALDELQDKVKAFRSGGLDYITKPFQIDEVMARVNTHLMLRKTQLELENAKEKLEQINRDQEIIISRQVEKISSYQLATIFALAELADSRDHETGTHLERTQDLCRILTQKLSILPKFTQVMDADFIKNLPIASALHDIGKVGIPDKILQKPGPLDTEEFTLMKTHTLIGARALREVDQKFPDNKLISMGIRIAESHHEKWDGSGYPYGLKGEAIPLEARIVALVDVYEALTSARPYKPAFSHEKSRSIIISSRGTHFDPDIVDGFLSVEKQFIQFEEDL
jgi:putative two-component system response regulator